MWFYIEMALFVLGFFMAYRAGWKSGWHSAFDVARKTIEDHRRQIKIKELRPQRKVEPSPLSEEEKQPLDE